MSRSVMEGADFQYAMIRDSHWIMADMRGANYRNASLYRVYMTMAKYDESTLFPPGFDPEYSPQDNDY